MLPPTQSIASVPTVDKRAISFGIATTSPRPKARAAAVRRLAAMCNPMSSIFTINATAP
jgi:hypothetical protein